MKIQPVFLPPTELTILRRAERAVFSRAIGGIDTLCFDYQLPRKHGHKFVMVWNHSEQRSEYGYTTATCSEKQMNAPALVVETLHECGSSLAEFRRDKVVAKGKAA